MTSPTASLAMYPFAAIRPAYERLWSAVADCIPDLPRQLSWPADVHATWSDDSTVVSQTCAWPLITELGTTVRVVGAFEYDIPEAQGHRYRSTIVATRPAGSDDLDDAAVAYNSDNSLSGWVSLLAWSGRGSAALRESGTESGTHERSLELLQSGHAEVASIDSVSLAHLGRLRPELLQGLHTVGFGPLVPSLPIIVRGSADDEFVDRLRLVLGDVVAGDELVPELETLRIAGFAPLDLADVERELAHLSAD